MRPILSPLDSEMESDFDCLPSSFQYAGAGILAMIWEYIALGPVSHAVSMAQNTQKREDEKKRNRAAVGFAHDMR